MPVARILKLTLWLAAVLVIATALAQYVDYHVYNLRFRRLDSNTHASIFGAVSLLADALAVTATFLVAGRAQRSSRFVLACTLGILLAFRIASPAHVLVLSLPFTGVALVLLWREGEGEIQRTIRAGCLLLVASFIVHALELHALFPVNQYFHPKPFQVRALVKHVCELAGWVLIAGGLIALRARTSQQAESPERASSRSIIA